MIGSVVGNAENPGIGVMLCHKSPSREVEGLDPSERSPLSGTLQEPALCAGFVAVMGFDSIGLRLYSLRTKTDPTEIVSSGGLDLYESLDEMMIAVATANRIRLPNRETET
jgi:hypothetical protein